MNAKIFVIFVMLFFTKSIFSTTIYVSLSGDNSDGSSPAKAFTSIQKASLTLQSGDTLLLCRGDIFRESVDFSASNFINLYIDAFGNEDLPKPIISGSDEITGWTLHKDNIYVSGNISQPANLFVNNKLMLFARWPNKGWIRISNASDVSGKIVMNCEQLATHSTVANDYWKNATMRWRRWSWWFETPTISQFTAPKTISVGGSQGSNSASGWQFYLDNKYEELDSVGEWVYYSGKAYVITGNSNVNELLIEAAMRDDGLRIDSSTIRNICFRHQKLTGLKITGNCIVENCSFENIGSNSGGNAISASWSVNNTTIRNNAFRDILNTAISWNQDPSASGNCYIEKNTFDNIGSIAGYGGTSSWHACGIIIMNGKNIHIQKNLFDTIGYAAILLGAPYNFAEKNTIHHAMFTLNDGAAIYTNCSYSTIRENIITNTRGNLESSTSWANLGHGIWPEFLSEFHDNVIEDNTVINSGGFGIFHVNVFKSIITGNTLYNNQRGQINMDGHHPELPQSNVINSNIFFAAKSNQPAFYYSEGYDFGSMNNNIYANPFSDFIVKGGGSYFPDRWSNIYKWADKSPINDKLKIPEYLINGISKDRIENGNFESSELKWNTSLGTQEGIKILTSSLMDNQCLQISKSNGKIQAIYNSSFPIVRDSLYEVKFSYSFSNSDDISKIYGEQITLIIKNSTSPNAIISYKFPATKYRREAWFVVKMPLNNNETTLAFEYETTGESTLNIDNIMFRKVSGREAKPNELTQILYNNNDSSKTFDLDENDWYDLNNKNYSDTCSLAPFTSKILLRYPYEKNLWYDEKVSLEEIFTEDKKDESEFTLFPNPVLNDLTVVGKNEIVEIKVISSMGKLCETFNPQSSTFNFSMQTYPFGIYIITIVDKEGQKHTLKIVKL